MPRTHAVILSDLSLFAEGVASRLREFPDRVGFTFIDPHAEDFLEQVDAVHPDVLIIPEQEKGAPDDCNINALLKKFPGMKIIRMAVDDQTVQIIRSNELPLVELKDLLDVINQDE